MIWTQFLNWIESVSSRFFVGVCLVVMIGLIVLIAWKIKNRILAIIFTAASCILCSIPSNSSINSIIEAKARTLAISDKKEEIKNLKLQVENESLKKDNENQNIVIGNLSKQIDLYKNSQLNMNSFGNICEVALVEAKYNQTEVNKEQLTEIEGKSVNEVLVITTHDINAKYGVDLKEISIYEDEKNILHVSGIKSKYIGSSKNETKNILKEIRKVEYKDGVISKVKVLNDKENMLKAQAYADEYENNYQERLSKGLENDFMNNVVIETVQNYIKITLSPLKKKIVFDKNKNSKGVPIADYLNKSIEKLEQEKQKALQ